MVFKHGVRRFLEVVHASKLDLRWTDLLPLRPGSASD
jgi:hypothetical protein